MGGADSTLDGADFTYPPGLGGLCGFVLFESVDGSGPCLLPFCPSCRPSSVLPNLPRGSWKGLWRSELQAATFPFGRRSGMCQCMAADAICAPQRGMLGLKLGISVTLKVCIGEGSVSLEGVTPSGGIRVSSSLSVFRRHRLPLPRGKCVWLSHLRSSTVGCRGDPAGGGCRGGGGSVGVLGVVDPLLVDLLALLSLSWPSDDLLFIWALRQSIQSCVCLILMRGSKVSPALSS